MTTVTNLDSLYKVRRGVVDFVDVPELAFVLVRGRGEPGGTAFSEALQALFAVSYAAHFIVKKESEETTHVMPLEALWWVPGVTGADAMSAPRDSWEWQAMIVQPPPIGAAVVEAAVEIARAKGLPAADRVRFERWTEGLCAQVMHVGPYADEALTVDRLHAAIESAGMRPRGRHHEIYLGDPRRAAPEKLRTILRQPVELD